MGRLNVLIYKFYFILVRRILYTEWSILSFHFWTMDVHLLLFFMISSQWSFNILRSLFSLHVHYTLIDLWCDISIFNFRFSKMIFNSAIERERRLLIIDHRCEVLCLILIPTILFNLIVLHKYPMCLIHHIWFVIVFAISRADDISLTTKLV
jgi:hypothetical protein